MLLIHHAYEIVTFKIFSAIILPLTFVDMKGLIKLGDGLYHELSACTWRYPRGGQSYISVDFVQFCSFDKSYKQLCA